MMAFEIGAFVNTLEEPTLVRFVLDNGNIKDLEVIELGEREEGKLGWG